MKKTTTQFLLACICLISIGGRALAQDADAMKKWTDFMTPGDMQKILAAANGKWSEDITLWMAPGQPPSKSTGIVDYKMILGGRYQQGNITASFNGMPYEAVSITGYDNMKKLFFSSYVDNMGTGVLNMEGPYDAATKTITLTGTEMDPVTGKEMKMRETLKMVDDYTEVTAMYDITGGKETKIMEITLKHM
ncbi:DUF1579 domain-containing protein [Mucilaginibacter sp. X4EP1]|uniref:DUF1579 domain-containing protein n=1 Tax=Mucilaginibacter sp. X4EP1 TaxID=2723092 RepID=UPI00216744A0|nr:DUF1579 domain-containing protein [Mucilaginibacter sp. X4EP1]MCS3813354.1 hypothetical protein [Mucilaginibacter sp. X4EP1]